MKCKRCGRDRELQPDGLCFSCVIDRMLETRSFHKKEVST